MCRIVDVLVRIDIALLAHGKPSAARQGAPHTTQRRERDASARGLPCWVVTLIGCVYYHEKSSEATPHPPLRADSMFSALRTRCGSRCSAAGSGARYR